jgi:RHS repeat-associated protein
MRLAPTVLSFLLAFVALAGAMSCDCGDNGDGTNEGAQPLCDRFCERLMACETADRLGLDTLAECIDFCHEVDSTAGNCVMAADDCADIDTCFPAGGDDDDDDDNDDDDLPDPGDYPGVFQCEPIEDDEGYQDDPVCWVGCVGTPTSVSHSQLLCDYFLDIDGKTWSVCSSEPVYWYCADCYARVLANHCGHDDWRLPTLDELETLFTEPGVTRPRRYGPDVRIRAPFLTFDGYAVVWETVYEPFGETYPDEGVNSEGDTVVMNIRFPGQYFDAETDLHYNWHRYYDPVVGRYLQPEASKIFSFGLYGSESPGLLGYVYSLNNPGLYVDPNGEHPLVWGAVAVVGFTSWVVWKGIEAQNFAIEQQRLHNLRDASDQHCFASCYLTARYGAPTAVIAGYVKETSDLLTDVVKRRPLDWADSYGDFEKNRLGYRCGLDQILRNPFASSGSKSQRDSALTHPSNQSAFRDFGPISKQDAVGECVNRCMAK